MGRHVIWMGRHVIREVRLTSWQDLDIIRPRSLTWLQRLEIPRNLSRRAVTDITIGSNSLSYIRKFFEPIEVSLWGDMVVVARFAPDNHEAQVRSREILEIGDWISSDKDGYAIPVLAGSTAHILGRVVAYT